METNKKMGFFRFYFLSIVFQIGIFPFLSLAFALFFFEPKTIQQLFLKKKPFYSEAEIIVPKYKTAFLTVFITYFVIQIGLPLRHWFIKDDVLWTEEGHRLSWRMMLRAKSGYTYFRVVDTKTNVEIPIKLEDYLTKKQVRTISTKPDVIWQFAQYLKRSFAKKGMDVKVYANTTIKVNNGELKPLINSEVDLANTKWNAFKHNDWILPSK